MNSGLVLPRTLTVFGVQVPAHPKFNTVITASQFRTGPPQQFAPETPLRARTLARAEQTLGTRSPQEFARTMALPRIALADVATRRFHGHRRSAAALPCSSPTKAAEGT